MSFFLFENKAFACELTRTSSSVSLLLLRRHLRTTSRPRSRQQKFGATTFRRLALESGDKFARSLSASVAVTIAPRRTSTTRFGRFPRGRKSLRRWTPGSVGPMLVVITLRFSGCRPRSVPVPISTVITRTGFTSGPSGTRCPISASISPRLDLFWRPRSSILPPSLRLFIIAPTFARQAQSSLWYFETCQTS